MVVGKGEGKRVIGSLSIWSLLFGGVGDEGSTSNFFHES